MNERIKELAEQSGINEGKSFLYTHWNELAGHSFDKQALAKFAELIVKECIQVAGPEDSYVDEWFKSKADSIAKIKEHFGVK